MISKEFSWWRGIGGFLLGSVIFWAVFGGDLPLKHRQFSLHIFGILTVFWSAAAPKRTERP